MGVGGTGVFVGGTGVAVGCGTGVLVGGAWVAVGATRWVGAAVAASPWGATLGVAPLVLDADFVGVDAAGAEPGCLVGVVVASGREVGLGSTSSSVGSGVEVTSSIRVSPPPHAASASATAITVPISPRFMVHPLVSREMETASACSVRVADRRVALTPPRDGHNSCRVSRHPLHGFGRLPLDCAAQGVLLSRSRAGARMDRAGVPIPRSARVSGGVAVGAGAADGQRVVRRRRYGTSGARSSSGVGAGNGARGGRPTGSHPPG